MGSFLKFPIGINWYLTRKCNLNCLYCYAATKGIEINSKEKIDKILRNIKEVKPFYVNLIGGEVFVSKYIFYVIEKLNQENIIVNLATNGTMLSKAYYLEKLKKYNVHSIQVSLDGYNAKTHDSIRGEGNFDKTVIAIKHLIEEDYTVIISSLLCSRNASDFHKMVELSHQLGVQRLNVNIFIPNKNASNFNNFYKIRKNKIRFVFKQIIKINKKYSLKIKMPVFFSDDIVCFRNVLNETPVGSYSCSAGRKKFSILPNGDVVACDLMPDEIEGNIFHRRLKDIWLDPRSFSKWRKNAKIKGKCTGCSLLRKCLGGCRAESVLVRNDFYLGTPNCWHGEK